MEKVSKYIILLFLCRRERVSLVKNNLIHLMRMKDFEKYINI